MINENLKFLISEQIKALIEEGKLVPVKIELSCFEEKEIIEMGITPEELSILEQVESLFRFKKPTMKVTKVTENNETGA